MQCFLGDPDSGKLHLETHRLALAIAKKTLDENRFTSTQKTVSRDNPAFQIGDHVYFKNKQPGKWDLKWRPGCWIVHIEHNRHYIHIKNQGYRKDMILQHHTYNSRTSCQVLEHRHPVWQNQLLY